MIERIVEAGIAATAAESVGAMEAMNEMTLEYSKTRVQFGQPIGIVSGGAASAGGHVHGAGTGPQHGDAGDDDRWTNRTPMERAHNIAMAKVGVGQAGRYVSQSAVQMHGGIGMTEEYAVGHYFRRCMVIERLFGDPAYYLAKLAEDVA